MEEAWSVPDVRRPRPAHHRGQTGGVAHAHGLDRAGGAGDDDGVAALSGARHPLL